MLFLRLGGVAVAAPSAGVALIEVCVVSGADVDVVDAVDVDVVVLVVGLGTIGAGMLTVVMVCARPRRVMIEGDASPTLLLLVILGLAVNIRVRKLYSRRGGGKARTYLY